MTYCNIHFKVYFHTNYSENVAILGNLESLGCWDARKPHYLKTNQSIYPCWETEDPIKVPSGAKLEFKFAVFKDNYLVRWENLPNCENRSYRPRYFAVTLDCVDSRPDFTESINKRFISSASLENLDEYKKVKKDKKGFNPFIDARGSMSSDSWDGSSRVLSEDMDSFILLEASPFRSDERGEDSIIESEKPKGSSFKGSVENRKALLRGHAGVARMSGLEKVISFDERRPDVLSMLYHQHRKQKSIPKNKPSCLVNCESEDEGSSLEIENETVELSEGDQVVYTSFRLPISVNLENSEGSSASEKWKVTINNSHLGSVYRIFRTYVKETIWIGWIGSAIEQRYQEELTEYLFKEYSCIPIFLEGESFSQFLNEYCNQFLHDAFFNGLDMKTVFSQEAFINTYEKINKYFADKILQYATVKTLIVVQDYHLMMIPRYLGLNNPKFTIAYVFETPFLPPEILKAFQNKNQLLESILSCDLICFNMSEYLKMLANISSKIMNIHLSCERGGHMYLKNGGRKVYTRVASPSIDPDHVDRILKSNAYEQVKREIQELYDSKTLMLGIAHLEKIEGITTLLQAIKSLFETDKNQAYQFCILQCEDAYKFGNDAEANRYKNQIQTEIRAINEMMSRKSIKSQIEIIDGVISEEKKFALMELSKLLIAFSPYLDNDLHILEYLFTKKETPGSIILSEFAHGHKHLNSLIKVNPFNKTEIIDGIKMGLARRSETIAHLLELDRESISGYTAWDRVHSLLSDLKKIQSVKSKLNLVASEDDNVFKVLALKDDFRLLDQGKLLCDFKKAKKRVIICSYEDTLVPEHMEHRRNFFEEIDPQTLHSMTEDNKDVIRGLTFCNDTDVYIVSKRQADTLAREFHSIARATLLAENGFSYRMSREGKWFNIFQCDWSWKSIVHRIMNNYANRTEGVQVSTNESSIVWNHGDVRPEIAKIQETALINHLMTVLTHVKNLEILKEREDIEVKPAGISKGITCELIVDKYKILEGSYPDFVLCIGGSSKDEEMFSKIEEIAKNNDIENSAWYTCTVQRKPSHAKYFVKGIPEMYEVLRTLAENG